MFRTYSNIGPIWQIKALRICVKVSEINQFEVFQIRFKRKVLAGVLTLFTVWVHIHFHIWLILLQISTIWGVCWTVLSRAERQGVEFWWPRFLYEKLLWTGGHIWAVPSSLLRGGPSDGWSLISSRQTCHRKHLPITFTETSTSPETCW